MLGYDRGQTIMSKYYLLANTAAMIIVNVGVIPLVNVLLLYPHTVGVKIKLLNIFNIINHTAPAHQIALCLAALLWVLSFVNSPLIIKRTVSHSGNVEFLKT